MTVHILNGEAPLPKFRRAKLEGEFMFWPEVLAEGKVTSAPGTLESIMERSHFFERFFEVSSDEYKNKLKQELNKLNTLRPGDDVVLWFDYDVFCQFNLLGAIALLNFIHFPGDVYIIDTSGGANGENVGLSQKSPHHIVRMLKNKRLLDKKDLEFAQRFFNAFASSNPLLLQELIMEENDNFPYLNEAIYFHLLRFPSIKNGLNAIENEMLKLVKKGVKNEHDLVGKMLQSQEYYDFGDLQYYGYIKNLKPLIDIKGQPSLTQLGERVIAGEEDFSTNPAYNTFLGGAAARNYQWTGEELIRRPFPSLN